MFSRIIFSCLAVLLIGAGIVRAADDPDVMKFDIDATKKKPISRFIYGWNHVENWSGPLKYATLNRLGGNRWTGYNWINNASNAGNDWHFETDAYLGGGNKPGGAVRGQVESTLKAGASIIITVPILGHVADKNVNNAMDDPDHLAHLFAISLPQKGAAFTDHPTLDGGKVYQDEFVNWLEKQFPLARRTANENIFYSLDNEPDLWSETHKELHPDKLTHEELTKLNIQYGLAIKAVAPRALTFGFVSYGWSGYNNLQGAPDANGRCFLDYYLGELAKADKADHKRAVDVLDLHWYSEAQGGGKRITEGDGPEVAKARIQATRSLWDPTYTEQSWITNNSHAPIALIPWVQEKIARIYPGTKLSFSEYNHGGGNSISGAIAEADTLGIFGTQDIFAAALWPLNGPTDYQMAALSMFRNYDGKGGAFGDTSLAVSPAADPSKASLYASLDSNGYIVIVAVNKTEDKLPIQINIKGPRPYKGAAFYLTDGKPQSTRGPDLTVKAGGVATELPPLSVSTFVLVQ